MSVSFSLPHPVVVSAFIICRGLCACAVCQFGSKGKTRLLVYSAGSGVNRVQVLSGFSVRLLCLYSFITFKIFKGFFPRNKVFPFS